jgi:hypothetical protein
VTAYGAPGRLPPGDPTWDGILGLNVRRQATDVTDGTSNTMLLAEANGNIRGATYTLTDNQGNNAGSTTINLTSLNLVGGGPVTTADLAPIVAFQLNLVDWANGGNTTLSSGAGTIVYSATTPLAVLNTEPACVDWNYVTVETANSIYSPMPAGPSTTMTQAFAKGSASAHIRKRAKVSHALRFPRA